MTTLASILQELDMTAYLNDFIQAGFNSWEVLCDITESDLQSLDVKLGHRRRLQRRIASERGIAPTEEIPWELKRPSPAGENDSPIGRPHKRKYIRHPKADPNAPKRPLSAYAAFANSQRQSQDYSNWSFADIAKHIGHLWRSVPPEEKEHYQTQAAAEKDEYVTQLMAYKQTVEYSQYQRYLSNWKADHARIKVPEAVRRGSTGSYAGCSTTPCSPAVTDLQGVAVVNGQPSALSSSASFQPEPWLVHSLESSTSDGSPLSRSNRASIAFPEMVNLDQASSPEQAWQDLAWSASPMPTKGADPDRSQWTWLFASTGAGFPSVN